MDHTVTGGRPSCVDPVEPLVWRPVVAAEQSQFGTTKRIEYKSVPFEPPAPYSSRDVIDFEPLSDSSLFFTLPTRRLYYWDGTGADVVITDGEIDRLTSAAGRVLFRWRNKGDAVASWNGLGQVTPALDVTVVWESTVYELEGGSMDAEGNFSVRIRHEGQRGYQVYDPENRSWGAPKWLDCQKLPHLCQAE